MERSYSFIVMFYNRNQHLKDPDETLIYLLSSYRAVNALHLFVKTGHLILCREIIAVYWDNLIQHINSLFGQNVEFLSAFATLRKGTISFVTSSRLSVSPHGTTRFPLDGFS